MCTLLVLTVMKGFIQVTKTLRQHYEEELGAAIRPALNLHFQMMFYILRSTRGMKRHSY